MNEYRKANATYLIRKIYHDILGVNVHTSEINVSTHLYNDRPIYNDNSSCALYHGAIYYSINDSKEYQVYYSYWYDTETEYLHLYSVLENYDGNRIGICFE